MANPDIEVVNQSDAPVEKKEFKFNPYCKDFSVTCDTASYESKESYDHFSYDPVFNVGTYYDLLNLNLYYPGSDPESPWMFENDAYSDATYFDSPPKDFKFSPSAKEFIVSISRETMLALRPQEEKKKGDKLDVKLCFTEERSETPTSAKTGEKKREKRQEDYYERDYYGRYPKYGYKNHGAKNWWYYSY